MKNLQVDEKKLAEVVGLELKKIRNERGLNQTDFAILCLGYNRFNGYAAQQKISKMETGKQAPTILELFLMLKALKIDFNQFIENILKKI